MKKLDILKAMQIRGISKATLCKRTNQATQNINSVIEGNPTVKKLQLIAEGLGCDITDLFFDEVERQTEQDVSECKGITGGSENDLNFSCEAVEIKEKQMVQTVAFCPHCGTKYRWEWRMSLRAVNKEY